MACMRSLMLLPWGLQELETDTVVFVRERDDVCGCGCGRDFVPGTGVRIEHGGIWFAAPGYLAAFHMYLICETTPEDEAAALRRL